MQQLSRLQKSCNNLSLLYVDDDAQSKALLNGSVLDAFQRVTTVNDGTRGLNAFYDKHFDIVIADVDLPGLSGLELIQKIKHRCPEVVVALTSTRPKEEYLLASIDLHVEKFLIKPFEIEQTLEAIGYLAETAFSRRHLTKRAGFESGTSAVIELAKTSSHPTMIYTQERVEFINDVLRQLLQESVEGANIGAVEERFLNIPDCLKSLEPPQGDNRTEKVALRFNGYIHYFHLIKTRFLVADRPYYLAMFYDITKQEYNKVKLENYGHTFRDYVFTGGKNFKIAAKPEREQKKSGGFEKSLQEDEKFLLRRSHSHKTSAREYLLELDEETLQQIQELDELNEELSELLTQMRCKEIEMGPGLEQFSHRILMFVKAISILFEFSDLIKALNGLVSVIDRFAQSGDEQLQENGVILLEAVSKDLRYWVDSIFINRDSLDIHYLDSSLFSSCLQLEMMVDPSRENDDDEDDIDFF